MIVFPCHVCRTDLSAEEAQGGQLVRCPSCLTTLRVPTGAPDPAAALHAMAGAGATVGGGGFAPPRPQGCGMPFTMEGTTLEAAGNSNGFCVASLVLGIIGIPAFCAAAIPSILAIIFGIIGYNQVTKGGGEGGGKGMAIAGIILGVIGCL